MVKFYRIEAPHFVAGIFFDEKNKAAIAAPILRWMIGENIQFVKDYCATKGWSFRPYVDGKLK